MSIRDVRKELIRLQEEAKKLKAIVYNFDEDVFDMMSIMFNIHKKIDKMMDYNCSGKGDREELEDVILSLKEGCQEKNSFEYIENNKDKEMLNKIFENLEETITFLEIWKSLS